jgi:CheY-like chemotaxis protein
LACHLWEKYNLEDKSIVDSDPADGAAVHARRADADNWNWLKGSQPERVADTRQALISILELTRPLANQNQVELEFRSDHQGDLGQDIPDLAVHPVALRQIMLNLLSVAIHRVPGGKTSLRVRRAALRPFVELQIDATLSSAQLGAVAHEQEHSLLDIATHLAVLCGANLSTSSDAVSFHADLQLPVVDGVAILVIDDNEDIIHLLQRYAAGTRYAVTGTARPDQALDLASDSGAQIIVLDVMMPKVDGWEMLGRLRQHPRTSHIPVIILTILAQQELALSLGARAHLMKPVTQEAFLQALDRISVTLAPVLR